MYQSVSACELLGYLTHLTKRAHRISELLGPELRAGNREKTLLNYSFKLYEETMTHCMHI